MLVLNFWASWCPPCVQETPSLSQFAAAYKDKGVVVLGISVDKDEKAYHAFLQRFRPAFLTVREFEIHEDYGTFMYPETYIINAKGHVSEKDCGARRLARQSPALLRLDRSANSPSTSTRSFDRHRMASRLVKTAVIDPRHTCFKMEIRESRIHRLGVYALENIPARRKVIEYTGEKISRRETKRRGDGPFTYLFTLDNYWTIRRRRWR